MIIETNDGKKNIRGDFNAMLEAILQTADRLPVGQYIRAGSRRGHSATIKRIGMNNYTLTLTKPGDPLQSHTESNLTSVAAFTGFSAVFPFIYTAKDKANRA